ncbi:MAG: hypothetical protein DMG49_26150 [Acidobacteria bacterium]|nr:MAG: hypothetical protein DMG49_26150 [Acidobacteriota bacterium]
MDDHSIYLFSKRLLGNICAMGRSLMLKADASANKYEEHGFLVMLVSPDSLRAAPVPSGRANNRSGTTVPIFPRAYAKLQQADPNGCVAGTCQHDGHRS